MSIYATARKKLAALWKTLNNHRCPVCGYDKPAIGTRYIAELNATFCSSRCRKIFEDGYMVVRGEKQVKVTCDEETVPTLRRRHRAEQVR